MQNLKMVVISDTSVAVSWSEAREAIAGYEVELRHYIQKSAGTAKAASLNKFALAAQEINMFIDSLSE